MTWRWALTQIPCRTSAPARVVWEARSRAQQGLVCVPLSSFGSMMALRAQTGHTASAACAAREQSGAAPARAATLQAPRRRCVTAAAAAVATPHATHQVRGATGNEPGLESFRDSMPPAGRPSSPLQVMHSLSPERLEIVRDLDHFAATEARERHGARHSRSTGHPWSCRLAPPAAPARLAPMCVCGHGRP
jgi:hypothetical protein